ncbi:putative F-box domain-containing protein [Tanacetum coccineum]
MSDYIPFEIQEEIIKTLPVKSLIRFRSVSKPWNSLIDSSKFIANYHICNPRLRHHILVSYTDRVDRNFYEQYVLIADDDTFPQQKLSLTIPIFHTINEPSIIGYSKGLFCFYDYRDYSIVSDSNTAILWNPAIRKSVSIVVPYNVFDGHRYQAMIGFGVCPHTSDPKLVKIAQHGSSKSNASVPLEVEIFTLSTQAWRSLSIDQPHGSIALHDTCLAIDKFIYWRAYEGDESVIMSFDMTLEELKVVYIPDSITHNNYDELFIFELKESLVMLEYNYNAGKHSYDVWMLKHGVPNSFTMLFSIDTHNFSIQRVLGFRRNGEPIIEMLDIYSFRKPKLFIYEPNSQHIDIGISARLFSSVATSYTETLLLLDH